MKYPLMELRKEFKLLKDEMMPVISDVLSEARFILGNDLKEFESSFAEFCQTKYAVGVSSGTSALWLALKSLGVRPGDEVIMPSLTFASDAEAVLNLGAVPVFADVLSDTFQINPKHVRKLINSRTKAVIAVHLHGLMSDMVCLQESCGDIPIIEDAAQAHGAEFDKKRAGSLGRVGIFSFFPAKVLGAYGDGGAVVTDDQTIVEKVSALRNHGRIDDKYKYKMIGSNERLDNLQAAILNVKLKHLPAWLSRRREIAKIYDSIGARTQKIPMGYESSYYVYTILVNHRERFMHSLNKEGIATGIYYPVPLHMQASYKGKHGSLTVTESLCKEIVSIPIHPFLSNDDARFIAEKVSEALR